MSAATANGFPGLRRNPRPAVDYRASRPVFPANDPRKLPNVGANPRDIFLRDNSLRTMGKALPRAAYRRAVGMIAGAGLRLVPGLGLALTGLELYYLFQQTGPLPRDPANPDDMAISFPSNWTLNVTTVSAGTDSGSNWIHPHHPATGHRETKNYNPFTQNRCTGTNTHWWDSSTFKANQISREAQVAGPHAVGTRIYTWAHRDARPYHAGSTSHGVYMAWHLHKHAAGPELQWTNPQRVGPIGDPVVTPLPGSNPAPVISPRWDALPDQPRDINDEVGYDLPPTVGVAPAPAPGVSPLPGTTPLPVPPTIIITQPGQPGQTPTPGTNPGPSPGSQPVVVPNTNPTGRSPPEPGTKERKANAKRGGVLQGIHTAVGAATEFLDLVNALWDALPPEYRTGYYKLHGRNGEVFYKKRFRASQKQRMADLYKHWDKLDLQKAMENIVENQIEDYAYGKLGQAAGKAGKNVYGDGRGLQFGPWDTFAGSLLK